MTSIDHSLISLENILWLLWGRSGKELAQDCCQDSPQLDDKDIYCQRQMPKKTDLSAHSSECDSSISSIAHLESCIAPRSIDSGSQMLALRTSIPQKNYYPGLEDVIDVEAVEVPTLINALQFIIDHRAEFAARKLRRPDHYNGIKSSDFDIAWSFILDSCDKLPLKISRSIYASYLSHNPLNHPVRSVWLDREISHVHLLIQNNLDVSSEFATCASDSVEKRAVLPSYTEVDVSLKFIKREFLQWLWNSHSLPLWETYLYYLNVVQPKVSSSLKRRILQRAITEVQFHPRSSNLWNMLIHHEYDLLQKDSQNSRHLVFLLVQYFDSPLIHSSDPITEHASLLRRLRKDPEYDSLITYLCNCVLPSRSLDGIQLDAMFNSFQRSYHRSGIPFTIPDVESLPLPECEKWAYRIIDFYSPALRNIEISKSDFKIPSFSLTDPRRLQEIQMSAAHYFSSQFQCPSSLSSHILFMLHRRKHSDACISGTNSSFGLYPRDSTNNLGNKTCSFQALGKSSVANAEVAHNMELSNSKEFDEYCSSDLNFQHRELLLLQELRSFVVKTRSGNSLSNTSNEDHDQRTMVLLRNQITEITKCKSIGWRVFLFLSRLEVQLFQDHGNLISNLIDQALKSFGVSDVVFVHRICDFFFFTQNFSRLSILLEKAIQYAEKHGNSVALRSLWGRHYQVVKNFRPSWYLPSLEIRQQCVPAIACLTGELSPYLQRSNISYGFQRSDSLSEIEMYDTTVAMNALERFLLTFGPLGQFLALKRYDTFGSNTDCSLFVNAFTKLNELESVQSKILAWKKALQYDEGLRTSLQTLGMLDQITNELGGEKPTIVNQCLLPHRSQNVSLHGTRTRPVQFMLRPLGKTICKHHSMIKYKSWSLRHPRRILDSVYHKGRRQVFSPPFVFHRDFKQDIRKRSRSFAPKKKHTDEKAYISLLPQARTLVDLFLSLKHKESEDIFVPNAPFVTNLLCSVS